MIDISKYSILYVDDEVKALKWFSRVFSDDFNILTAENAEEGWLILEEQSEQIGILLTDQRMPGTSGVELLERTRKKYPHVIRILVTAFADLDDAISAVNSGEIYKYISKPWNPDELRITLLRALEFYVVQLERDALLYEKLSTLDHIVLTDRAKNLALLAGGMIPDYPGALAGIRGLLNQLPPSTFAGDGGSYTSQRYKDFSGFMREEGERLFAFIQELQKFRDEVTPGKAEPTSGEDLLGALDQYTPGVDVEVAAGLPEVRVNRQALQQSLRNLVGIHAALTGEGYQGLIQVEAGDPARNEAVRINVMRRGDPWTLDQHQAFFAPFLPHTNAETGHGWKLLHSFILAHQQGGAVKISGNSAEKISVGIPAEGLTENALDQQKLFNDLFCLNQNWEVFYTHGF